MVEVLFLYPNNNLIICGGIILVSKSPRHPARAGPQGAFVAVREITGGHETQAAGVDAESDAPVESATAADRHAGIGVFVPSRP